MSNLQPGTTDEMVDEWVESEESDPQWDDECHKCGHLRTDHETGFDPEDDTVMFDGPCQMCSCKQFV